MTANRGAAVWDLTCRSRNHTILALGGFASQGNHFPRSIVMALRRHPRRSLSRCAEMHIVLATTASSKRLVLGVRRCFGAPSVTERGSSKSRKKPRSGARRSRLHFGQDTLLTLSGAYAILRS